MPLQYSTIVLCENVTYYLLIHVFKKKKMYLCRVDDTFVHVAKLIDYA
jgi:hypothetical protein